jgi:predicted nucleic acid-binding protein
LLLIGIQSFERLRNAKAITEQIWNLISNKSVYFFIQTKNEKMKKFKIYLVDTSVIKHLNAQSMLSNMKDTLKLWQDFIDGKYDIVISDLAMTEVSRCPETNRTFLYSKLAEVKFEEVKQNTDSKIFAKLYFKESGLPLSSVNDAKHITIATMNNCNYYI